MIYKGHHSSVLKDDTKGDGKGIRYLCVAWIAEKPS